MHKNSIILLVFLTISISCKQEEVCEKVPEIGDIRTNVSLKRLDEEFFNLKTKEEVYSFLSENPEFQNGVMEGGNVGTSQIAEILFPMIGNDAMDTVRKEIRETFGDFKSYQIEFEEALSRLKFYYPETPDVELNTFVSGLRKDLYIPRSYDKIFVGLDYFLGNGATYRPNNYEYVNKRYHPAAILPLCMQYVSGKYNKSNNIDNTLLAQMIYYGKAYYFTKQMLPCVADSTIIGYNPVEWEGSEMHIKTIWGVFIERELLYETSHFITGKYVNERPKTLEVGNKCPGRIGQFLGWKIVKKYMENNPDVTLQELMAESDARKIFTKSKFKPEL